MKMEKFGYPCEYYMDAIKTHHWVFNFDNKYGVSVIGGGQPNVLSMIYGDGKNNFEVAILRNGAIVYDTPLTNNVLPYQTTDDVRKILDTVSRWKKGAKGWE